MFLIKWPQSYLLFMIISANVYLFYSIKKWYAFFLLFYKKCYFLLSFNLSDDQLKSFSQDNYLTHHLEITKKRWSLELFLSLFCAHYTLATYNAEYYVGRSTWMLLGEQMSSKTFNCPETKSPSLLNIIED